MVSYGMVSYGYRKYGTVSEMWMLGRFGCCYITLQMNSAWSKPLLFMHFLGSVVVVKRKIRTRLDLLSTPQSGGGKCRNV